MPKATAPSAYTFHGTTFDGVSVSFSLEDVLQTIEFDTGKKISQQEIDATNVFLLISQAHVDDMANRVIEWRRMSQIKDIFLAEFEVRLPNGESATFTMKQYLAATEASLPNHPFDAEAVRAQYQALSKDNQARVLVYFALQSHLNKHH